MGESEVILTTRVPWGGQKAGKLIWNKLASHVKNCMEIT